MFISAYLLAHLILGALLGAFHPARAQEQPQDFVPGELIVGYQTPEDKNNAVREFSDPQRARGLSVRGQSGALNVQPLSETSIKLKIEIPGQIGTRSIINPSTQRQALQELARNLKDSDNRIKYVHPNWILGIRPPSGKPVVDSKKRDDALKPQSSPGQQAPNDPIFIRGLHWHYQPPPMGMNAVGAWKQTTGSRDVVVAVLDTGILPRHSDIAGSKNVLPGYSFVSGNGEKRTADATDKGENCPTDGSKASWHGSHVAGTVGAVSSNNGLDITGVNWAVSVLPVRVLGRCEEGNLADIADAIRWAAGLPVAGAPVNSHPAHVISMSLGGIGLCVEERVGVLIEALQQSRSKGAIVVAAAGNESGDVKNAYPGGCKGVISVAANDKSGHLAWYSNFGDVTIMAPGGDTRINDGSGLPPGVWSVVNSSADNPEGVEAMQGTSMAAPHVSGAIALALAKHPDWRGKPDLIEQKLRACSVRPLPDACPQACGVGQLDAERLINCP